MTALLIATVVFTVVIDGSAVLTQPRAAVGDPALLAFIEQTHRERQGESFQQAITVDSLNLLARAVVSIAQREGVLVPIADDVARLRSDIRGYQSGEHDDERQGARLHRTLVQGSALLQRLVAAVTHDRRPSDSELSALRRTADSVDGSQFLRRKPNTIDEFWSHAVIILERLDQRPAGEV